MTVTDWEQKIRAATKLLIQDKNTIKSEKLANLQIQDEEDARERLYNKGYVLVDTGETRYLESFCISLLQSISGHFQCQLAFEDIAKLAFAKEWKLLTSGLSNPESSIEFLKKISECIYFQDQSEVFKTLQAVANTWDTYGTKTTLPHFWETRKKIISLQKCILGYSKCNFTVNIIRDLAKFEESVDASCSKDDKLFILYEDSDVFYAIVPRKIVYPEAEQRAGTILEDIRTFPTMTRHFDRIFRLEDDLCSNHVTMKEILDAVENCTSISEIVNILSKRIRLENGIIELLLECESKLSSQVISQLIPELKSIVVTSINASMQQLILAERDIKRNNEREAKIAKEEYQAIMRELIGEMKEELDKLENMKRQSESENREMQRLINKVEVIDRLKLTLTQSRPSNSNAMNKLSGCRDAKMLAEILTEAYSGFELQSSVLELDKESVRDIVEFTKSLEVLSVDDDFDQRSMTLKATHLTVSNCLDEVKNLITKYRTKDKNETIQVNFIGKETLVIDTSLGKDVFHGVNLAFASKFVYIEGTNVISINVSGDDGTEHLVLKPATPSALGATGDDGLQGDFGESGGNVYLYASEKLLGLELLEIKSNGGRGARGQDGGDGHEGEDGVPGEDGEVSENHPTAWGVRHEFSDGKEGTPGKNGGDSGCPGMGGRGGFGGCISIQSKNDIFSVDAGSKRSTSFKRAIGKFESKNGENGKTGDPGVRGDGGLGGKHGFDEAWFTESAWWFDEWKREKGFLELEEKTSFFKYGFIANYLPDKPDATNGTKGHTKHQHNQQNNNRGSQKKKSISFNAIRANVIPTLSPNQNKATIRQNCSNTQQRFENMEAEMEKQKYHLDEGLKSMTTLENSLQDLESFEEEQIRECQVLDELSAKVKNITEEYHRRFISLQHQYQNIQVTNNKLLFGEKDDIEPGQSQIKTEPQNIKFVYDNHESPFKDLYQILDKQENYKNRNALENYIQGFLLHHNELPAGAKVVLTKIEMELDLGTQAIGGFDIFLFISETFPAMCREFKNYSADYFKELKFLDTTRVADIFELLYNLFDQNFTAEQLQEIESFVLKRFGPTESRMLLSLLEPKWVAIFIPQCVKALSVQKGYLPSRPKYFDKYFGENVPKEISKEQKLICDRILENVLTLQRKLLILKPSAPENLSVTNVLKELLKVLENDKNIDALEYPDKIFKNILKHDVTSIVSALPNANHDIHHEFYKVQFILRNFQYDIVQLQNISDCRVQLENYKKGNATKLAEIIESVYKTKFEVAIVNKIFSQLKAIEGLDNKKTQLNDIVDLEMNYKKKLTLYERFLESCRKHDFEWEPTMDSLKEGVNCNATGLRQSLAHANNSLQENTNPKHLPFLIKQINVRLLYIKADFDELSMIEKGLIKLLKHLKRHKLVSETQSLKNSIRKFWERQLQVKLAKPIRSSFENRELKYQEWSERIENLVEELLDSNMIYDKQSYLGYVKLKMNQIIYWAKAEGRFADLEKIVIESQGNELERLIHILNALDVFKIPDFPVFEEEAGQKLVETINNFLNQNAYDEQQSKEKYSEIFNCIGKLLEDGHEETLQKIAEAVEVNLVKHSNNDETLQQFNSKQRVNSDNESNSPENAKSLKQVVVDIKKKVIAKLRKRNAKLKEYLVSFIDAIWHFVTNDHEQLQTVLGKKISKLEETVETTLSKCNERIYYFVSASESCQEEKFPVTSFIKQCGDYLLTCEGLQKLEKYEMSIFEFLSRGHFNDPWWINSAEGIPNEKIKLENSWLPLHNTFVKDDIIDRILSNRLIPSGQLLKECLSYVMEEIKTNSQKDGKCIYQPLQLIESIWKNIHFPGPEDKTIAQLRLFSKMKYQEFKIIDEFWKFCWDEISKNNQSPEVTEFFQPKLKTATRLLISRIISKSGPKFNFETTKSLINYFENVSKQPNGLIVENELSENDNDILRSLLTKEEVAFVEEGEPLPTSELINTADWKYALQHHSLQKKYQKLSFGQSDQEKEKLGDILTIWSEKYKVQEDEKEFNRWLQLLMLIATMVKVFPVRFSDIYMFFNICCGGCLSLETIESIIKQRVPKRYMEAALLNILESNLVQKYKHGLADGKIKKILDSIETFIFQKNEEHVKIFLKSFVEQTSECIPKLEDLQKLFQSKELGIDDEELLSKMCTSHFSKWNWHFRTMFYQKMLNISGQPEDGEVVEAAVEVETKYIEHTERFIKLFIQKFGKNIGTLKKVLGKLKNGVWILNEEILRRIEGAKGHKDIEVTFTKFMEDAFKTELKGSDLINSFAGLKMNSESFEDKTKKELCKDVSDIHKKLNKKSDTRSPLGKPIKIWTKTDVELFCKKIKDVPDITSGAQKTEVLAVICRGVQLAFKKSLRDTQLLSILLFITGIRKQKGIFGEIATSEGKTMISASFAIFLALAKKNVNIITSSPVLATSACKEMRPLFEIFGIGVANICDDQCRKGASEFTLKQRYGNQVLYGDAASFQTDFLNSEYLGKDYTRKRDRPYLIVDEVDSMLLDKGTNVLYISHNIPELRWLRRIFIDIWGLVKCNIKKVAIENRIKAKYIDVTEELLKYPKFLLPFVKSRIPIWINNAFTALEMDKNVPYVISQGEKVTIIDLDTGVEQDSMQYSYGLHQFLQLKHGNKISSESLKAIYISNLGYFRRFKGNIFGISGTLGDEFSQQLLGELYDVEFYKMPRFRLRTCIKEPAVFATNKDEYLNEILKSVNSHKMRQPILLICENVKCVNEIEDYLKKHLDPESKQKLIAYVSSQENSSTEKELSAGWIIISTNLAGRGTDLDIAEDCESGLHVILTYLPPNTRVEKQAFGRTARAGRKGSTQYIVLKPAGVEIIDIKVYQDEMVQVEKKRLTQFSKRDVPRIELEEKLLKIFFTNLERLELEMTHPKNLDKSEDIESRFENAIKYAVFKYTSCPSKPFMTATMEIIKNSWAFWLDGIQHELQTLHLGRTENNLEEKLREFFSQVVDDVSTGNMCKTPSDYVKLAKAHDEDGRYEKAAQVLQAALKIEDNYNEICHYYLGVCLLKRDSKSKAIPTRREARKNFKIAKTKLEKRALELKELGAKVFQLSQMFLTTEEKNAAKEDSSSFTEQINNEIQLQQHHIREFLDPVLGYNISAKSFQCLPSVNQDENESEAIFNAIKEHGILKKLRISKKVQKPYSLQFKDNQLKTFQVGIKNVLTCKLESEQREVNAQDFKEVIMTREKFWKIVEQNNFVEKVEEELEMEVSYDEEKFIENFNQFPTEKLSIGKILSEKNFQPFKNDYFKDLNLNGSLLNEFVQELEMSGHLVKRKYFKGEIVPGIHKALKIQNGDLIGLPETLTVFKPILCEWVTDHYAASDKSVVAKQLHTRNLHMLPHDDSHPVAREDIINQLISEGVIKSYKVRWSLDEFFGKETWRKEYIGQLYKKTTPPGELYNSLKKVFEAYHPDDAEEVFDKYLTQINDELINSVGLVKTLPELKVNAKYRNILDNYSGTTIPPEAVDLLNEEFDRIPDVKEKIPWWCSGATYVALLGVLQIAVGVTIGVLSGGTLANVSMMFISEGGSDIMFAIQSGLTGNFSWKTYGMHKLFSVGASVLTGGLGGITGASLANIVLMEIAEEILKKVAWTVGRYTLQGVGSTLLNMTIEKALDSLRQSVLSQAQFAAQAAMKTDQEYCTAKKNLEESLRKVHAATYRPGQLELLAQSARSELGPENSSSALSNAFSTAMQRVAYYYTSKITEKLTSAFGNGLVEKVSKLFTFLFKLTSPIVTRFKEEIKKFAVDYINHLTRYFNQKAEALEKKRSLRVTHVHQTGQQEFNNFSNRYLTLVDNDVVDEGLKKFQQEYAEPSLKQIGNRWLDSRCHKHFKGLQADYSKHASYTSEGNKEGMSMWHKLSNPSKHYAMEINTRLNLDTDRGRNNIWDHVGGGHLSELSETFATFGNFINLTSRRDGSLLATFLLCQESQQHLSEVEAMQIPVVRKFVL